mmetsp:Transcript_27588/g.94202  ORF Transcript_27588/g.94202 Transcript_27588/m.94202 type:complete len:204 (+) Transcript_27588:91-702(+)
MLVTPGSNYEADCDIDACAAFFMGGGWGLCLPVCLAQMLGDDVCIPGTCDPDKVARYQAMLDNKKAQWDVAQQEMQEYKNAVEAVAPAQQAMDASGGDVPGVVPRTLVRPSWFDSKPKPTDKDGERADAFMNYVEYMKREYDDGFTFEDFSGVHHLKDIFDFTEADLDSNGWSEAKKDAFYRSLADPHFVFGDLKRWCQIGFE